MRERDMSIQQRGQELVELAAQQLPREFEVTGDADAWPFLATALVARMTTTLRSILQLHPAQLEADAGILLRSLYEHAVHLAWLGADPSAERIEAWRKHDLVQRLKANADAHEHGIELFSDKDRAELQAQVEQMHGGRLVLADLAKTADLHWAGKLPGMGSSPEAKSFRGLYAIVYRHYSGVAHPSFRGLNRVIEDLDATHRRVHLEGEYQGSGPYGLATVMFGLVLYVTAKTLGWPPDLEIHAVFERHP
jgi:Family of unknown function (DUF5677)